MHMVRVINAVFVFASLQRMISLIKSRITRNTFDDVMEVAWATMWNVTDETPINCERFLDLDGMKHFISCLKVSYQWLSSLECNYF